MYKFKPGTMVKSITYDKDLSSKTSDWHPIMFEYSFKESELVDTSYNIKKFERKSEDGKIHHYYVKYYT